MYRFLVKKKGQITRNLSNSVLEKFNRYEVVRSSLSSKEREEFVPINVVHESINDETVPVPCYFTNEIHLAYISYIGTFNKGNEQIIRRTVRQCCFCQIFFAKNEENMKNHMSICSAREGITYAFDNGQILNYQDNFTYLGDLPFTVYFDFETTTGGNSVFFDPSMYVISYCQIYSFHPSLNLDKIVIFRSYQQTAEQIYDLSHFKNEHAAFFNKTTFYQLKDAASAVLAREKSTSLAELFSVELKFTVDTLKDWFSRIIKPKFFEIDSAEKQKFRKDNPPD